MHTYEHMMKSELKTRFMDMRSICHMKWVDNADRVRALAEMARIRRQIAELPKWARRYN